MRETQPRRTRQPVAVSVTAAAMLSASNPTFSSPAQSTLSFCGELGRLDGNQRHCCSVDCKRCGGIGCGLKENGPGARECCPVRWEAPVPPCTSFQRTRCKLASSPAHRVHAPLRLHNHSSHTNRTGVPCACHGGHAAAYRGRCLPSFMVIGSQKAATSKLRWYLSRHPQVRIPKEEKFHQGPTAVKAWDTAADPTLLEAWLENFDDVCGSPAINGLKMPDYIVMSNLTVSFFQAANPQMRLVLTLREPIARMYSYFSMQLRLGWSPINHMGRNPCMQQRLKALRKGSTAPFTSEEIMSVNLQCVRPCYAPRTSLADVGTEDWHNESNQKCKNIYFTPLVHSMYSMHIKRWLRFFARESLLILRFDDLVLRPLWVLQQVAAFVNVEPYSEGFRVEVGRANYTTMERLVASGTIKRETHDAIKAYLQPYNAALDQMFPSTKFW